MQVDFEEKDHIYFVNGEIATISVTELLHKHKLAPDYGNVNKNLLKKSAERGKEIHKDLEDILMKPNYSPKSPEGEQFLEWVKENLDCGVGEQKLGYIYNEMIIAGTADVMGFLKDGSLMIADHKTTSKFQEEYVSWQVSLLDYFARQLKGEKINGKVFKWKGAAKFYCFHYHDGKFDVHELKKIPDEEIEQLIKDEYEGRIYQRRELVISNELKEQFLKAEKFLAEVEKTYKEAEENAKKIREQMLSFFEQQNIKSWESPSGLVKVSYIEPSDRISVDSTKLKKEYPEVYSKCQKLTKVKSQIRVTIREENEDE